MKEAGLYISLNPETWVGKPCIINTRIPTGDILQWLASGMAHAQILEGHRLLKEEHIVAAPQFAANRKTIVETIPARNTNQFKQF